MELRSLYACQMYIDHVLSLSVTRALSGNLPGPKECVREASRTQVVGLKCETKGGLSWPCVLSLSVVRVRVGNGCNQVPGHDGDQGLAMTAWLLFLFHKVQVAPLNYHKHGWISSYREFIP